jgi:RNA polymerase sigma factor (sigma-70 family)
MSYELLEGLLDKLARGDLEAAGAVFETYAPYLRAVIRRRLPPGLRSKLDSVDILQSAWSDILAGLRDANWRFTSPAQLQAFLVRVMHNRCVDRCRQFRRPLESERPLEEMDPEALTSGTRPFAGGAAEADELWQRLLALCPPEHHEVLRLKRDGATPAEIARHTGLHEGSVRRLLRQLATRVAGAHAGAPPG